MTPFPALAKLMPVILAQADNAAVRPDTSVQLVIGILLFAMAGFGIVFGGLLAGSIARPQMPHPEKAAAYECGEPAIGESWVQFDLRFYTVALVFIVFDVEVALLWPWAVTFRELGAPAFWAFLVFFLLIAIPFLYEWKSGYLDWVRASTGQRRESVLDEVETAESESRAPLPAGAGAPRDPALAGAGSEP
jgi:NADH-quinone oxidoreductase subunit A